MPPCSAAPVCVHLYFFSSALNLDFWFFQFDALELRLLGSEESSRLKAALNTLSPKPVRTSDAVTYPDGMAVVRCVCRHIAPDEIMQFFTREKSSRWANEKKRILSEVCPTIYGIIVGVVAHNAGKDFDQSMTLLTKHLNKCSDRKRSRELLSRA